MSTMASSHVECLLKEAGVGFAVIGHDSERDAVKLAEILKLPADSVAKGLVLSDKRKKFFVVVAPLSTQVNLKALGAKLGTSNLRFASAATVTSTFRLEADEIVNFIRVAFADNEKQITWVLSDDLEKNPESVIHVQTDSDKASVSMKKGELIKLLTEKLGVSVLFENFSSVEAGVPSGGNVASQQQQQGKAVADTQQPTLAKQTASALQGSELLGITVKKNENFPLWYTQVLDRAELIDYYDISGCYIIRPAAFAVWKHIKTYFDARIAPLKVKEAYFPMFISKARLETEKDHVEGFSPEVAWVTKYGDSDLPDPIAIRPTSETVIYPAYARWIRSYRNLPLAMNQWCQVVRWEFKQPTPFIRTREFLWQEGHSAHCSAEEAKEMVFAALDIYADVYQELLAVPVIKGIKSETEKFAGGVMTTTVETLIPTNGRGVQAATSHDLGQNFSKMFEIIYETKDMKRAHVYQTSWGLSTRSLGVMVMVHGDDKGMIFPPRVADKQVVVIPIVYREKDSAAIMAQSKIIASTLEEAGLRVELDDREGYTPGWKFNDWEVKGVPLRIELGPQDLAKQKVVAVTRKGKKCDVAWVDLKVKAKELLDDLHKELFAAAKKQILDEGIVKVTKFSDVMPALNSKKLVLAPWCRTVDSEEQIKAETTRLSQLAAESDPSVLTGAMKVLCIPLDQPPLEPGTKCFFSGEDAVCWALFGRSY